MLCQAIFTVGFIFTLASCQCMNLTERYGDFYYSVHSPSGNPTTCQRTFFPPNNPRNTALLLKVLHVFFKNESMENVTAPDETPIPYLRRNFYGSPNPAWCGVYVDGDSPGSSCKPGALLTDSCPQRSRVSARWPPTIEINTGTRIQLLMTYSFIDCPAEKADVKLVKDPDSKKTTSTDDVEMEYGINKLSVVFLAVFVFILSLFLCVIVVQARRNAKVGKQVFVPPTCQGKYSWNEISTVLPASKQSSNSFQFKPLAKEISVDYFKDRQDNKV